MLPTLSSSLTRAVLGLTALFIGSFASALAAPAGENDPAARLGPTAAAQLRLAQGITAVPGAKVTVPITYAANGNEVASVVFSLDIDPRWLMLDTSDRDQNGVPDAIAFDLTPGLRGSAVYNAADTDGELDVLIYDTIPPLAVLTSGTIMTMTFTAGCPASDTETVIQVASDPPPSAGNTSGRSVDVEVVGASVMVMSSGGTCRTIHLPSVTKFGSH